MAPEGHLGTPTLSSLLSPRQVCKMWPPPALPAPSLGATSPSPDPGFTTSLALPTSFQPEPQIPKTVGPQLAKCLFRLFPPIPGVQVFRPFRAVGLETDCRGLKLLQTYCVLSQLGALQSPAGPDTSLQRQKSLSGARQERTPSFCGVLSLAYKLPNAKKL